MLLKLGGPTSHCRAGVLQLCTGKSMAVGAEGRHLV